MAFQPIINVAARRVSGYEALVRGSRGEPAGDVLGLVTPDNRYAFDQACRRKAIELAGSLGIAGLGTYLSINFIPGAMYRPEHCIQGTLAAAREAGLPLNKIVFEVTEGEKVEDADHLLAIFAEYRRHGLKTAIDDFGDGYAGLNLLAQFQPDWLKLDMKLVRDLDRHSARRAIVGAVVGLGRELGIDVVAEGVERAEELAALRDLGVELCQGYLFARPAFEALPPVAL